MTISLTDVTKISKLACIHLNDSWIDQLTEIDISHVNLHDLPKAQMQERDDIVTVKDQSKEVTQNAPQVAHNMYAVPKVVE